MEGCGEAKGTFDWGLIKCDSPRILIVKKIKPLLDTR
jgi:hypothetical protein